MGSERARDTMVEGGCPAEDFLPCQIDIEQPRFRYLHVPVGRIDCVDVARSTFDMILPAGATYTELPIGLRQLTLVAGFEFPEHAHATRLKVPGHDQVFAELVVDEHFKARWEAAGLTGIKFSLLGDV